MATNKVVPIEDRIPKLKEQRRQKANNRFIAYITLFFILILIVIYVNSSLSLVGNISIKGNHFVSTRAILSASSINHSTHIWDVHTNEVKDRVQTLPAISSATVTRSFPNRLMIVVKEYRRIAYLKNNSSYIPILENGTFLSKLEEKSIPINAPILINWQKGKQLNDFAKQLSLCKPDILSQISEVSYTPIKDDEEAVTVFMNDGNKVLADISQFNQKIDYYPEIKSRLNKGDKGIVNIRVGMRFTPYGKK